VCDQRGDYSRKNDDSLPKQVSQLATLSDWVPTPVQTGLATCAATLGMDASALWRSRSDGDREGRGGSSEAKSEDEVGLHVWWSE
jgi:hypothetical protein